MPRRPFCKLCPRCRCCRCPKSSGTIFSTGKSFWLWREHLDKGGLFANGLKCWCWHLFMFNLFFKPISQGSTFLNFELLRAEMPSPLLPLKITARDFPENLRTVVPAFLPRLLRPFREVFQAPSLTLELCKWVSIFPVLFPCHFWNHCWILLHYYNATLPQY